MSAALAGSRDSLGESRGRRCIEFDSGLGRLVRRRNMAILAVGAGLGAYAGLFVHRVVSQGIHTGLIKNVYEVVTLAHESSCDRYRTNRAEKLKAPCV
jgi:hypothetical protein